MTVRNLSAEHLAQARLDGLVEPEAEARVEIIVVDTPGCLITVTPTPGVVISLAEPE